MAERKKREYRIIKGWPRRLVVIAEGYAMVRARGCVPIIIGEQEWLDAPLVPHP